MASGCAQDSASDEGGDNSMSTEQSRENDLLLADQWCWHLGQQRRDGRESYRIQPVPFTVTNVALFWQTYHAIPTVQRCQNDKINLYLFKKSVQVPVFEDPANQGGSRWMVELSQAESDENRIQQAWLELCMLVVGATLPEATHNAINGIVWNYQSFGRGACRIRLEVWFSDACTETVRQDVEQRFMATLKTADLHDITQPNTISFKPHAAPVTSTRRNTLPRARR